MFSKGMNGRCRSYGAWRNYFDRDSTNMAHLRRWERAEAADRYESNPLLRHNLNEVAAQSPRLPVWRATSGKTIKERSPTSTRLWLLVSKCGPLGRSFAATSLRLKMISDGVPKVAPRRGNLGLCGSTSLRLGMAEKTGEPRNTPNTRTRIPFRVVGVVRG